MLFKVCKLGAASLLVLFFSGCDGDKKGSEFDDLERMAEERVQPLQHQNLAEKGCPAEGGEEIR